MVVQAPSPLFSSLKISQHHTKNLTMIFGESFSIEDNDTDNLTPPLPCLLFKVLWLSTFIMSTLPAFWRCLLIPPPGSATLLEFSRSHYSPFAVPFPWKGSAHTTRRHGSTPLASFHSVGSLFCCGPSNTWRRVSLKTSLSTAGGYAARTTKVRLCAAPHRPDYLGLPTLHPSRR